ncbi:unnamed protein product [Mycena citricolor]|uniref:Phospholipid-transporting ATPase n=1 Tax=Mycena citricolor TaxID=2018698 RepID=A0AAD2K2Q3_9AGAR|nr:unnamed protein product [Mycena citricolor]
MAPDAPRPWYKRVLAFSIEGLFTSKREPGPPRTVYVNQNLPADLLDHKGRVKSDHVYTTNQVITSKYTIITFLPRNLLEQFRRVANLFFLALAIIQFFPTFATVSVAVAILPLLIVLAFSAIKDGWEDVLRHLSDKRMNHSQTLALSADGWINPNKMGGKSKTFVPGVARPKKSRPVLVNEGLVVDSADWEATSWEDIRVGDFVKVRDHEAIPADMIILATSEDDNVAFVETKNLDGETNLKSRHAVQGLSHLGSAVECAKPENAFSVQVDRPDNNMYRLNATVTKGDESYPIDLSMTLLRGTVLRNTEWAIGVVVFTGQDTKIMLNSGGAPSKRGRVERQMDPQVLINLSIMCALAVACAIGNSVLEHHYASRNAPWLYGDNIPGDNPSINGLITFIFAFLTFQTIVPISLYISMEVVRSFQAAFIFFDKEICYDKTGQATIAKSWNLADDLGQIEYIFSDKTGTLTQNLMVFRECSVGGKEYTGNLGEEESGENLKHRFSSSTSLNGSAGGLPHFKDVDLTADLEAAVSANADSGDAELARSLNGFFKVLGLCHTVLTGQDSTGALEYKSQSPDEAALVQAAADVGFVFLGRDRDMLSLRTPFSPEPERYQLLNILEFTSARKRMSVVVRHVDGPDNRLFLLTKGADSVVFERLRPGNDQLKDLTETHLSNFANNGLRTLTLAYKIVPGKVPPSAYHPRCSSDPEDEYTAWSERYHEASIALDDREEKIEAVSEELEKDLRLLGATAIEDKLQDGVPETIADLKRAGIKIWVATGDKLETAIAIGKSTNLITPDSNIIIVRSGSGGRTIEEQMQLALDTYFPDGGTELERTTSGTYPLQRIDTGVRSIVGDHNGERPGGFVLVIDGGALLHALDGEENKATLLKLGTLCEGVICCRVSPLQKALIVRLVKDGLHAMTLAIGDGANDVSMIQAADVGVGISGEEGLQAANSSDYAIAQFRFLKKLLLVHGHWSYSRNGTMILNFFYKNIVPTGVLFWFQIYDFWSATFVFAYVYILFWNSLFTVLPVIAIGVFDRFADSDILMAVPELYHFGRERHWFNLKSFAVYMLDGLYQSVILFFFIMNTYITTTARSDGYSPYINEMSTTMALSAILVANFYTGLTATAWTFWIFFALAFGLCVSWGFTAIYSLVRPGYAVTALYGNYHFLFTSAAFWLSIPLTFFLAFTPRFLIKAWNFGYNPNDIDMLRWMHIQDPERDLSELTIRPSALKPRPASMASRRTSRTGSITTIERPRMSVDMRSASRTDMSTGLVSVDRGFDFATEERGPMIQRMQTNLSEKRMSNMHLPLNKEKTKGRMSIRKGLKSLTRKQREHE